MLNDRRAAIRSQADLLFDRFKSEGALPVEADSLQPAETLLDLYGEDIRARAYVTFDPVEGEQMLRPDFTVPVVEMHMNEGAEPARYTYNGTVWRKQEAGSARPSETLQVGFEIFDRENPEASDAEVFALFSDILGGFDLRAATGDLGILIAAISGLKTIDRRKAALLRHIWRPARFRQLLERFQGLAEVPKSRADLLAAAAHTDVAALCQKAGSHVGMRGLDEIAFRVEALCEDAASAPISSEEAAFLSAILALRQKSDQALLSLSDWAKGFSGITPAVERFERRLNALSAHGIDTSALDFEGSYGRTTLEYYDGFVFGFYAENRPDLPVVASGGRYDALTEVLGQGRSIPAVGGIIRPEALVALQEGL